MIQHSYSKLSLYEGCPYRYKLKYIMKLKVDVDSKAMLRGIDIHDKAEKYVLGKLKKLPAELKNYKTEFDAIKQLKATGEVDLSYDAKYRPCQWNDWGNVWVITKPDAIIKPCTYDKYHLDIFDYKTGKSYPTHKDQSDMSVIAAFVHYPDVDTIHSEFWMLDYDQGEVSPGQWDYARKQDFKKLKASFKKRYQVMVKDTKFKKISSWKCAYCEYSSGNSGDCPYPI